MKIYYAHSMHIYNTNQEARDVHHLELLGFDVLNPNCDECQGVVECIKKEAGIKDAGPEIMEYFGTLVKSCSALAFRGLFDGSISAGVWKEVQIAREAGIPIIELPHLLDKRALSISDTRSLLGYNGLK